MNGRKEQRRLLLLYLILSGMTAFLSVLSAGAVEWLSYGAAFVWTIFTAAIFYFYSNSRIEIRDRREKILGELTEHVYEDELLQAVANNLSDGVLILDAEKSHYPIVYANEGFTKLTGYAFEEVVGKNCRFLAGEKTKKQALYACGEALRQKKPIHLEILHYTKSGRPFWNEVRLNPLHDESGRVLYFVAFFHDITERKTYEQLMLESEQRYKSLFENNPEIVLTFDKKGKLLDANPALEKITGYKKRELVGERYLEIIEDGVTEDLRQRVKQALKGKAQNGEMKIKHKNGDMLELEVVMIPIQTGFDISGFYVIAKDLTEFKQAEQIVRKTEKLNVVGELAAGIAHEIRNPLTSLKGFIQLLRPNLTTKQEYAEVMLAELDRIEQIVSELLLLAKPKPVEFQKTSLEKLLKHVNTLLNTKAIMNNIEIVLEYRASTKKICCDENQLKQVFINLIKNAIEAMPDGGKIIVEAEDDGNGKVCVRVIDEGEGIPEEHIARLGEPFYTTKEQGTGLGLMISSNILKDHGGKMAFRNNQGKGATVEVTLPATTGAPAVCHHSSDKKEAGYSSR